MNYQKVRPRPWLEVQSESGAGSFRTASRGSTETETEKHEEPPAQKMQPCEGHVHDSLLTTPKKWCT